MIALRRPASFNGPSNLVSYRRETHPSSYLASKVTNPILVLIVILPLPYSDLRASGSCNI
jgi:hypothetical protein